MLKRRVKILTVISLVLAVQWGMDLFGSPAMAVFAAEPGITADKTGGQEGDDGISGQSEAVCTDPMDITVPIYNYDVLNVLVPTSYSVAFNPYGLDIRIGEEETSSTQVISRNYGIVNKSTRDKLVTVMLTVEDLNGGEITFVDSADEALNADKDIFAVYLALVPADESEIMADGMVIGKDITAESLAKVSMGKAEGRAAALKEGTNQAVFKLSGAEYGFIDNEDKDAAVGGQGAGSLELISLAADGAGVTAFTFEGAMNPKADWTKLVHGVKISVVYAYENTEGGETILEGTGAMTAVVRPVQ